MLFQEGKKNIECISEGFLCKMIQMQKQVSALRSWVIWGIHLNDDIKQLENIAFDYS